MVSWRRPATARKFNGTGGSKYPNLKEEFSHVHFKRGLCRHGAPRRQRQISSNSQFFIMFADAPNLDGQYTVIGEVVPRHGQWSTS